MFLHFFFFSNILNASIINENLTDQIETEVVEAIFNTHQIELKKDELNFLPKSLKCFYGNNRSLILDNLNDISIDQYHFKVDLKRTGIIIDWSDGDQVNGLFLTKNALNNLNSNEVTTIPVKIYEGYWWADGDHYKLINAECSL